MSKSWSIAPLPVLGPHHVLSPQSLKGGDARERIQIDALSDDKNSEVKEAAIP